MEERAQELSKKLMGYASGLLALQGLRIGDRLGIYSYLAAQVEPITHLQIAEGLNLNPRFLKEWLSAQAAADFLHLSTDNGEERFYMDETQKMLLANEGKSPLCMVGLASMAGVLFGREEEIISYMKTGKGCDYDSFGGEALTSMERFLNPWRSFFLASVFHSFDEDVKKRLDAGAKVGEIGCGGGQALVILAKEFPQSEFHGYDISEELLKRAAKRAEQAGPDVAKRVHFHNTLNGPEHAIPQDGSFDLFFGSDCIHDMADAAPVLKLIAGALRPETGRFLSAEPTAADSIQDNIAKNPLSSMMYAISLNMCLPSSVGKDGHGIGLGTLGLGPKVYEQLATSAGLTMLKVFPGSTWFSPINTFYLFAVSKGREARL